MVRTFALVALFVLIGAPASGEGIPIIHFSGYGYESGALDWSHPGEEFTIVAEITSITGPPDLPYYPADFEYTLVVTGLISPGEVDMGGYSVIEYEGGELRIFEDPSFNADWQEGHGPDSPPSTFIDGELWLSGAFSEFGLLIFQDTDFGYFEGRFTADGGLAQAWFEYPWPLVFGGNIIPGFPGYPDGYEMSLDGEIWNFMLAATPTTLSKLKALY